jgi:hypothetical protein
LAFRERYALAGFEILEPHALHGGHVKEEVFPTAYIDETETFVRQSFDGAFSHSEPPRSRFAT